MVPSSRNPPSVFLTSHEIYGHVLLLLKRYTEAKEIFEENLQKRFGRTLSLLGLARAHAMLGTKLGHKKKADYLYEYLRTQLKDAGEDNPVIKEAKRWVNSNDHAEKLRDHWILPYFSQE